MTVLSTACSQPAGGEELHGADELEALTVELPTCGRFQMCGRTMGVERPNLLVLEDAGGEESFVLRGPEYDAVLEIALLPGFQEAMADPDAWTCPALGEQVMIRVEWTDSTTEVATVRDGCFQSPEEPSGIYDALLLRLVELKNKYLDCPPAFALPGDLDPARDPPPVRPLCFACFGQC